MTSRILTINGGKAAPFRGEERSAICKQPLIGRVRVTKLGIEGDEQADLRVHGGPDKAIHHYPREHYAWWSGILSEDDLATGSAAFGENVATADIDETQVCIGDRWRLGSALVEVSQGRQPCWKLDHRFAGTAVMANMIKSRRSGWYYRVIEEGEVAAGDELELVDRVYPDWSVARVFGLLIAGDHRHDRASLDALGTVSALAEPWALRRAALLA